MKIDDNELKRLLKEGMEYEADLIMREVESDPNMKDVVAPDDLHTDIWKQIREREEAVEKEQAEQEKEEQELIRLGKKYKKKLSRRKYIILMAAVVCALAVGSVSFGDGEKVFSEMKRKLGGREQTVVNSGDGEDIQPRDVLSEEEAYEQIEERFGFYPVEMYYMPEGMEFSEFVIEEDSQNARLYYEGVNGKNVLYRIVTDYRTSSTNADIEDIFIREYEKELTDTNIIIKEYEIEENKTPRWSISFSYKDAHYALVLTAIEEDEVEKIVENLHF